MTPAGIPAQSQQRQVADRARLHTVLSQGAPPLRIVSVAGEKAGSPDRSWDVCIGPTEIELSTASSFNERIHRKEQQENIEMRAWRSALWAKRRTLGSRG